MMLLNNDTVVEPGFLELLVEALELDEPAAAACSQMVFLDEPERVWYAGADFRPGRGHHGTNWGYGQPRLDETVPPYTTDRACGGAILIGSDMLSDVGLFDESLFAYAEDTDWSLRAARRGHHVLVVPASVVRHAVSKSSGGCVVPRHPLLRAAKRARRCRAVGAARARRHLGSPRGSRCRLPGAGPTLRPTPRGSTGRPRGVARLQARTVRPAPPDVGSRCGDGSSRTG